MAGGISDTDRKNAQKIVAQKIRDFGFDVYSASENDSINDKSNDPTPIDIYNGDIDRVKESDIFIVRISGGNEDGTLSEIGMVAGWNEQIAKINHLKYNYNQLCDMENQQRGSNPIKIIAYTTNERLFNPDFSQGIPSAGFNHLVLGMIQKWGLFVGNEDDMLDYVRDLI